MSTRPLLADVAVVPGAGIVLDVGDYEQVLVFAYGGDSNELKARQLGVYGNGDKLVLRAGERGFEALVLSGTALREPIAQYGPFVMNQPEEIEQAIRDFQQGRLVAP
jgi:redox-sensitive bicupin YhaK (pirin superfamily)